MHASVLKWVEEQVREHGLGGETPVLEVGSCNVNGSIRPYFNKDGYVGVDIHQGPGVDQVVPPVTLPFESDRFAVVVSTEMLEHAEFPVAVMVEMRRVLRPDGVLILTARSEGFGYHNPPDYNRFSIAQMQDLLQWIGFAGHVSGDPECPGVFVFARKATPRQLNAR